MSLEKKLKDTRNALSTDHHLPQCCEKNLILLIDTQLEELGEVAQKIRDKRDKIQKVIDEEEAFRKRTAFHDFGGVGKRGFSEIEMDKFRAIVEQFDWILGLLVEQEGEK